MASQFNRRVGLRTGWAALKAGDLATVKRIARMFVAARRARGA